MKESTPQVLSISVMYSANNLSPKFEFEADRGRIGQMSFGLTSSKVSEVLGYSGMISA